MSHYETLGVPPDADKETIKKAYRRKAKGAHTDRAGGDHNQMVALNRAKDTLLDDEKRARYDAGQGDDPVPPLDTAAEQMLAQAFDQLLSDENNIPAHMDPLQIVARTFRDGIKQCQQETKKADLLLERLEKKAARIKRKGQGNDLWTALLGQRRQRYVQHKCEQQERIKVCERVLEMLADYEGAVTGEAPPANPFDEALKRAYGAGPQGAHWQKMSGSFFEWKSG